MHEHSAAGSAKADLMLCVQEHKRIRGEYEARLRELEAERHMVEEDLAQVDRWVTLSKNQQRPVLVVARAQPIGEALVFGLC